MNNKVPENKYQIQWWKIVVCIAGVLMIAGAVTYILMSRASASTSAPSSSGPAPVTASSNGPIGGPDELKWVNNLSSKFETNDFIFMVFPGNEDLTKQVDQVVQTSIDKIKQGGAVVESMTLSPTDPEFQATLDRLAIQKLPAILLMASSGQVAIIKSDITETKLFQAYLTLVKTCIPGSSGCCPK
jgi:hypothetical protein